jgi:hypothetical protein
MVGRGSFTLNPPGENITMAKTVVADVAMAAGFDGYQITNERATAVTNMPTGVMRAGGATDSRHASPIAQVTDVWEYLAEGGAWAFDACD